MIEIMIPDGITSNTLVEPHRVYASGIEWTVRDLEYIRDSPLNMFIVPIVAINGIRPTCATKNPFKKPAATPIATATKIARYGLSPKFAHKSELISALRHTTDALDKSNCPAVIINVTPTPMMPVVVA